MLRLTKLTDYAIVVLTHFAVVPDSSKVLTARGLAEDSHLPLPTVSKVLKSLARAGLLSSQRGVSGGYTLARPAGQISVAAVIAAIEGPIALTECTDASPTACGFEPSCLCRSPWQRINDAVRGTLERLTIADMVAPRAPEPSSWPPTNDALVNLSLPRKPS